MIDRAQGFQYPAIQTQYIPSDTPNIAPAVSDVAGRYGASISQGLQQPRMSFQQYMANPAVSRASETYSTDFAVPDTFSNKMNQAEFLYGGGNRFEAPGPVDTEGAYKASLDEADRRFKNYLIPGLNENMGRRGLRYSSAINEAGARSYGDIQAQLGTEAAKSRIGAQEAYAGRQMAAPGINMQRAGGLRDIGTIIQAIEQQNQAKRYQEFLRMQPDAYYSAAQGFVGGAKPLYPQVITGGQPMFTREPSQLDAANQYLQAIANISGVVPTLQGLFE